MHHNCLDHIPTPKPITITIEIYACWLSLGHCFTLVVWVESYAQNDIVAQMKIRVAKERINDGKTT